LGACCPDLDKKFGLRHRTITHSLIFVLPCLVIPCLGLGVGLHVLLDLLTPTGTQLLYPKKEWYILMGSPLRTGVHDTLISALIIGGLML